MNESENQTQSVQPVAPVLTPQPITPVLGDRAGLATASLIMAIFAAIGPVIHWLLTLAFFTGRVPGTTEAMSSVGPAVLVLLALVVIAMIEWVVIPTVGLASIIMGIIAARRGGRGRKMAVAALIIMGSALILAIAQIIYWNVAMAGWNNTTGGFN